MIQVYMFYLLARQSGEKASGKLLMVGINNVPFKKQGPR